MRTTNIRPEETLAEALPDKDVDIVLTHEEAQHIADRLFPWL